MPKIERPTISVAWAENGKRIEPSQTKIAGGWVEEIPPHQFQNWYQYNTDQSLRYFLQSPIPEWSSQTDYYTTVSFVLGSDGVIYQALQNSNSSNPRNPANGAFPDVWRNSLVYAVNNNNSASATKLQTARKISNVLFDGTRDITLKASDVGALPQDGNATSATKLQTARKISNVLFDGTRDITLDGNYINFVATVDGEKGGVNNNIKSITGLTTPLSLSQGGTGGNTIDTAKKNLQIDKFQQQNNESRIFRNDGRGYLSVLGNGLTGYYDISTTSYKWSFDGDGRMQTGTVPIARVEGLEEILRDMIPIGVPIPYPAINPPSGWIIANGQGFSASTYPELAKVYPNLRLPDLRGSFIRGWDNQRGSDPNRTILSEQDDALQKITGSFLFHQGGELSFFTGAFYRDSTKSNIAIASNSPYGSLGYAVFDSSLVTRSADETRPKNIAYNYILRAK